MKVSKVWDGTDPGATPGRVFTASINQEEIIPEGKNLNFLKMGVKGAVSTAAVAVETFAGVLSEYAFKVGSETRILGNLNDLVALMTFYFGEIPAIGENTDNTGNDFIAGVKIPVYTDANPSTPFTHTATRTAVTNIGTETISLSAYWDDSANGKKPIHAVKINRTTSAAAGYDEMTARIAPVGKLIGLIVMQANGFADGNIDVSVQRLRIKANGVVHSQFNLLGDFTPITQIDYVTPTPMADLLRNYALLDLRPSGLDAKAQELTIELDVQDVSDAIAVIPVLELA